MSDRNLEMGVDSFKWGISGTIPVLNGGIFWGYIFFSLKRLKIHVWTNKAKIYIFSYVLAKNIVITQKIISIFIQISQQIYLNFQIII